MKDLQILTIEEPILARNDALAGRLRARFRAQGTTVLNLLSSPGSGKTALLERTLAEKGQELKCRVIVGDLATAADGERLSGKGCPIVQIETGGVCHLDAAMIERALTRLPELDGGILFIENVGNLVCPAAYDLGEARRVVLLSVTEGEDMPLKYPSAFAGAHLVVLTKIDLAAAVGFDRNLALANVRQAAPRAEVIETSARTYDGFDRWYRWLEGVSL